MLLQLSQFFSPLYPPCTPTKISFIYLGAAVLGAYMFTIQQEDITLVNIYAPNTAVPKYIKEILVGFKEDIDNHTVIIEDLNNPLSTISRVKNQQGYSNIKQHTKSRVSNSFSPGATSALQLPSKGQM